jgi:hypothetical protein
VNSLIFFIFTFSEDLMHIILFKKKFDGIKILFEVYLIFILKIFRFILILVHCSNLFSLIRIIEIYKNQKNKNLNLLLIKSSFYIFLDILILIPGYFIILLLLPVFICTHINIYKKISINEREFNDEFKNLCPIYNIIKSQIFNDLIKVVKYIIAILLSVISFIFLWNLATTIIFYYKL